VYYTSHATETHKQMNKFMSKVDACVCTPYCNPLDIVKEVHKYQAHNTKFV